MRIVITALIAATALLTIPVETEAARVRTRKGPRGRVHVTVRPGFPIRRTLPNVVVRPAPVVRVAPRVYLGAVAFTGAVVATLPPRDVRVWTGVETLEREDGWTDFTMNVDRRGTRLLLDVENGSAQISFAEVVFENGSAQVVDFNDRVQRSGIYSLLDFADGRKVDHVRIIARPHNDATRIRLHLVS
jgi:hypothetical protein